VSFKGFPAGIRDVKVTSMKNSVIIIIIIIRIIITLFYAAVSRVVAFER